MISMSVEESKAIVNRVWHEVFNAGKLDVVDELVDTSYVYYGPGGYEMKGPEGLKQFVRGLRTSFPDLHFTVEDLIAEGDKVVSRWTLRGTRRTTNKQVAIMGIIITRVVGGKCVEDWEIYDRLYMAEQGATGWFKKRMVSSIANQIRKLLP
jgi:predicted SnoaL-like aldol condensation-catalyzing enzyme